jgi:non-canonical poly(A) RNA polymerase PAPD5/7
MHIQGMLIFWQTRTNLPYRNIDQAKFSIIDPNKADNDISGGSSNTFNIRKAFANAFDQLHQRIGELHTVHNRGLHSLLGCIIGGNYRTFELQREHLEDVYDHLYSSVEHN